MSNRKHLPHPIYSPLKIQSDQKDIIIAQLKQEVYHLKKNQAQYYHLQDQYKKLEHKYRLLAQQKNICDGDFKQRHQIALRNICGLRNQLDAIRGQLRQRGLQLDDLQTDQGTLKGQIDQRLIQIDKLKNQLNCLYADGDQLNCQRSRLDNAIIGLRGDNQGLLNGLKNLQLDNQSVRRKMDDLDKYLNQLKVQENLLKDKILAYQNQNNGLDGDINQTMEDLATLDRQNHQAMGQIKHLQNDIAQISAKSDKYKSQSLHFHKAHQTQVMKNNDLGKMLNQADNTFRVRINQVQQGRSQIGALRGQNDNLEGVNSRLAQDMEFCRKHLQNLALLNADLVLNLEKFSQQDQVVRHLIDRRSRVQRAKAKVQQTSILLTRSRTTQGSPVRISKY